MALKIDIEMSLVGSAFGPYVFSITTESPYVAISVPVVAVGIVAEVTNIRDAGLILAAAVAALALTVVGLLVSGRARRA